MDFFRYWCLLYLKYEKFIKCHLVYVIIDHYVAFEE